MSSDDRSSIDLLIECIEALAEIYGYRCDVNQSVDDNYIEVVLIRRDEPQTEEAAR